MKAQLREACYCLKQSSLGVRDHAVLGDHTPHYHNEFEIIYLKLGNATLYIGDSVVRLKPGDIVFYRFLFSSSFKI